MVSENLALDIYMNHQVLIRPEDPKETDLAFKIGNKYHKAEIGVIVVNKKNNCGWVLTEINGKKGTWKEINANN